MTIFSTHSRILRLITVPALALGLVGAAGASAFACVTPPPPPPPPPTATSCVDLGAAASYAVLAAATVTNTGPSVISGNLGVSPGTAVTGFPTGQVTNGTIHSADTSAAAAKVSLAKAYTDTAALTSTVVAVELGGKTFGPGVYSNTTLGITGAVTLNANGNPNAVFVFQSASTLITASNSNVILTNGAKASNVCWLVGSSATLGTNSHLAGTVMAYASITATTGTTVTGRLLAKTAAVTLDTNAVTLP